MYSCSMSRLDREQLAQGIIRRLGIRRAARGCKPHTPTTNPTGYDGIDRLSNGLYRARIRQCDALGGQDHRVTLGKFETAREAGKAYKKAHIELWGSLSYFIEELVI